LRISPPDFNPGPSVHQLVAYVADLELEVDRLRKQDQYVRHAFGRQLHDLRQMIEHAKLPRESSVNFETAMNEMTEVIEDLGDTRIGHPAHDQVAEIAVRPLIEQIFRWQQRLTSTPHATLHLELSAESINWFPARFCHILDNLISNALEYRDANKGQSRVSVSINHRNEAFEVRVTDNGLGIPTDEVIGSAAFQHRATTRHTSGIGVGLSVVRLLIEQSGGSLHIESDKGNGSQLVAILPRYDVGDYIS
jgi:signal transduction histidine kinase